MRFRVYIRPVCFHVKIALMHNVLIVDEEEHLLSALEQNLFPDRDDITILTASNGEMGLEHLKNSRVDLLISDIKMPGKIDGFQLILRAKEVAPDARVIIITAFGSNRVQNFAARIGITHYIEKPFNTSELRDAVLEILDEKEGFQGVLSDLELTDIIQMLCLARRTALLHLKHRDHRGRIVFDNGDVVHAEFDELLGEDAVYRMLALRQGDIFMQGDFQNEHRTISMSWQDLLLEGVRRADEERADLDEDSELDDGPSTDTGMGLNANDVEKIVQAATSEPEDSFFSDAELREIEAVAGVDDEPLPFATLDEDSEDERPPGAPTDSDEFRSPFQRENSGLSGGFTTPGGPVADPYTVVGFDPGDPEDLSSIVEEDPPPIESDEQSEPSEVITEDEIIAVEEVSQADEPEAGDDEADVIDEPPPPAPMAPPPEVLVNLPFESLHERLERFAHDCPGLRHTVIISREGMAVCAVSSVDGFDYESFSAMTPDLHRAAQTAIDALGNDVFDELHVTVGEVFVLLRPITGTPYHHVAIVDRDVSLGVGLVMMRRLERDLRSDLETS